METKVMSVIYLLSKIKSGGKNVSSCDETKHPEVHVSMGLVRVVSHLKTHRQEGDIVDEE